MAEKSDEQKGFSIRQMEVDDLAEVYDLGAQTFTADQWPMLYRSWDEYEVTSLFNTDGEYCLVAENDEQQAPESERIIGFVLGTVLSKTGSAWSYGYVTWLCAHTNWLREGVATRLVDKLVERMIENDGIRIVMADTDPENGRAVRFFERMGFTNRKAHLYLSSNLEQNDRYKDSLEEYRQNESGEESGKPKARPKAKPKPKASSSATKRSAKHPARSKPAVAPKNGTATKATPAAKRPSVKPTARKPLEKAGQATGKLARPNR